ncbi:MAG: hypothetical protein Ct9H300mP1_21410 [Planctomycetaceae bacterium]|nr:MAG: hypothetical protein Ct9H300mP1_21410 [Planctomycetaceae bacterium]
MLFDALHQRDKLLGRTPGPGRPITTSPIRSQRCTEDPGKSWRDAADMDLMNKIYQVPGTIHVPCTGGTTAPREKTQTTRTTARPWPCLPGTVPGAEKWREASRERRRRRAVRSHRRVPNARFVRIGLEPAWWNDLKTKIEAYTLQLGPTWFLNVISHRKKSSNVTASIDTARAKLDSQQPIFCWHTRLEKR